MLPYNPEFIYALFFTTLFIWFLFKVLFDYDNFGHALVFAIIALVFLPAFVFPQTAANFILLFFGLAILASYNYRWSLEASVLIVLVAFFAAAAVLPMF